MTKKKEKENKNGMRKRGKINRRNRELEKLRGEKLIGEIDKRN